jgi:CheY-like chemotaxis protein
MALRMATLPQAFRKMTSQQKGKVLVIDDDRSIRELLSLHLANRGYDVAVAEDAIVGGKLALAAKPQLIIIDVNMPYLDGPDFVAALKSDPLTSDIPVVFLTSDADVIDRASKLGAVACLTKPIMADRLLDVVARAI